MDQATALGRDRPDRPSLSAEEIATHFEEAYGGQGLQAHQPAPAGASPPDDESRFQGTIGGQGIRRSPQAKVLGVISTYAPLSAAMLCPLIDNRVLAHRDNRFWAEVILVRHGISSAGRILLTTRRSGRSYYFLGKHFQGTCRG